MTEQLQHFDPTKVVGGEHHLGAIQNLMEIYNTQTQASAELNTSRKELREKLPDYQVMNAEKNEIVSVLDTLDNQDYGAQKALHTSATAIQWMVRTNLQKTTKRNSKPCRRSTTWTASCTTTSAGNR